MQSPASAAVTPALGTTFPQSAVAGTQFTMGANLQGGDNPTGSIVITIYGPNVTDCTGTPPYTAIYTIENGVTAFTVPVALLVAGTHSHRFSYSGDANNNAVSSVCNVLPVAKATPVLNGTFDTGDKPITTLANGTVTISGGINTTGTITLTLHRPDDPDCTGAPFGSFGNTVTPNDPSTTTVSFNPNATGTYRWKATYSGDANNNAVTIPCGNAVTWVKAQPALTGTFTTGTLPLGSSATGAFTLTGGFNRTGEVKVELFGPTDPTCASSSLMSASVVIDHNSDGTPVISGSITASSLNTAGVYTWRATYEGDENNAAAAIACGVNSFTIAKATPVISGTATPGTITLGATATDVASITSAQPLTEPVTFKLYNNDTCTGTPVSTSTGAIVNGAATSATVTPATAGIYHWVASYPGDAKNDAVATACLASAQQLVVNGKNAAMTARPNSAQIQRFNTTTLIVRIDRNATGTMVFDLYGPNDPNCLGTPLRHESLLMRKGTSSYTSEPVRILTAGVYHWVARYSGDSVYAAATSDCAAGAVNVR